ncbi:MAG: isoaspartyl peptidase/L-asparaginase [Caulobacteraceae bacterium]
MERTGHVLLAGEGAAPSPPRRGWRPSTTRRPVRPLRQAGGIVAPAERPHGTVGCAALDREGRLAVATSTGGTLNKLPGRVGDSPLIGAGTWADHHAAVSCTGHGEAFIRCAAAAQLAMRLRFAGQDLAEAAAAVLDEVRAHSGDGGLIALGRDGAIAMPFNSEGMNRAAPASGWPDRLRKLVIEARRE